MRNLFKNNQISNKLFSLFTNTAVNSSSKCNEFIWQQAKVPKCLLTREIRNSNNQR